MQSRRRKVQAIKDGLDSSKTGSPATDQSAVLNKDGIATDVHGPVNIIDASAMGLTVETLDGPDSNDPIITELLLGMPALKYREELFWGSFYNEQDANGDVGWHP